jgi:hypothetical protein
MGNILVYDISSSIPLISIMKKGLSFKTFQNKQLIGKIQTNLKNEIDEYVKENILENTNTEEDPCPSWVKRNIKIGDFGEVIAVKYLESMYKDVDRVSTKSSKFGYDITVGEEAFEVKTSTANSVKFYISYNELKVAEKLSDKYNIFYIHIDERKQLIHGFIINNPIKELGLSITNIAKVINLQFVTVISNSFCIELKEDFIENLEVNIIDMTPYALKHI